MSALWTVRGGKVVRFEWFHGPAEALEAMGRRSSHVGARNPPRRPHRDRRRQLAGFYLDLLGPLGWAEEVTYPTYRGRRRSCTCRTPGRRELGLRPADGGAHRYYEVGIEHLAFEVDRRDEVDAAHQRCLERGVNVHFPPEEDRDVPGYWALFVFDPDGMRIEVFCWP